MDVGTSSRSLTAALLPFAAIVFFGYAAVGIPLSTLPLQVHDGMGYGTTVVGAVMGLAPGATLLTRQLAGRLASTRGPKLGVLVGLVVTACSGLAYLVSQALPPSAALTAILGGRVMVGLGDSLFTTAVIAWAVSTVGAANAGRAMSWVGIAMYAAFAAGAPVGAALGSFGGFTAVAIAVTAAPLLGLPVALALRGLPGMAAHRVSLMGVAGKIWPPGLGLVLASSGFGTIAAFLALRYAALGWSGAGLALTGFGALYIVSRLFFAGLPDRLGGIPVAMVCLVGEAAGLCLIAAANSPVLAFFGTALTGLGYSMVFPALGVEVVRRVPASDRGVALAGYLACFDLGLGAAGPAAGLVAAGFGLPAAFVGAAGAALLSLALVWMTRTRR